MNVRDRVDCGGFVGERIRKGVGCGLGYGLECDEI